MSPEQIRQITRRDALAASASALGALVLGGRKTVADTTGRYGPFKMGLQSYSLRHYKRDEALAKTKELGIHYWESYSAHTPIDLAKVAEMKNAARDAEVQVIGFGVSPFSKNTDANRKIFEFGRAMGVSYLSADPTPDAFDSLDKLVEEYGIAIGIHPHGPGSRWQKIDQIWNAVKDHHEKIGLCNDTGHLLRIDQDPIQAVEVFGKRTYGVHLKDVTNAKTFTILGQGDLRLAELLKSLNKINYQYCLALEYEENEQDPIADIRACLDCVAKTIESI